MNRFIGDKEIAMHLISKCGCSSIFYNSMCIHNIATDEQQVFEYKHLSAWHNDDVCNAIIKYTKEDNKYYVGVIRDPLERIKSAYYTLTTFFKLEMSTQQYVTYLIEALEQDEYIINRHVLLQFRQYDYKETDLFVHINDLNRYFSSINIENCYINKSIPSFKKIEFDIDTKLLSLLEKDYDIYNDILNSDKLFRYNY